MTSRVSVTAERLQELALQGVSVEELLQHAISSLRPEVSPFSFIASLREAFGVSVLLLRERAEGWEGLGLPGCDLSTDSVVAAMAPFIESFRASREST